MGIRAYQLTAGVMSTYPQTDMNDYPASLGRCMIGTSHLTAVIGFIDLENRYKLVATQVSHGAGLVLIPPTGNRTSVACHSTSPNQYSLNLAATEPEPLLI